MRNTFNQNRTLRRLISVGAVAVLPLLLGLAGCQPCAGTSVCTAVSRVALSGSIVDGNTGAPTPGARIYVQLAVSGTAVISDTVVTDADGIWEFDRDLGPSGSTPATVTATVTVTGPGHASYTPPPFAVNVVTRKGDAMLLGAWLSFPHTRFVAAVLRNSKPIVGATVKFAPTGGVAVEGAPFVSTTNVYGGFTFDIVGNQAGNVVGTLTITDAVLKTPVVYQAWSIPLDYKYGVTLPYGALYVGQVAPP